MPQTKAAPPDELAAARKRARWERRTEAERRAAARRREQARREAAGRRGADSHLGPSAAYRTVLMIIGVVVAAVILFLLTHYL